MAHFQARAGKYKVILKHLLVYKSKEALWNQKDGGLPKGHKSQSEKTANGQG